MKKIDKNNLWILLILISAIFSYLVIVPGYFPFLGIAISLATLSSLVFFFKSEKSNFALTLYLITLILSFYIFYRANGFLVFINFFSLLLLGSLMALTKKEEKNLGLLNFLFSPFNLFFHSFNTKSEYAPNFKSLPNKGAIEIIKSLLVSLVILSIIIPLLASANPLFHKLVSDFAQIFNLQKLFTLTADTFIWIIRICFFLILSLFIPGLITYINIPSREFGKIANLLITLNLLLPKILVGFIIFVFFITQTQLYFANKETLQILGYTNSQYTREVFAQLSLVALIIFAIIYNDKGKKTWSTFLTYLLVLEGVFLTFIALKSVYDYSTNWGFTYKRLWGYTEVIWLLGIFSLFLYKYYKNIKDSHFVKEVALFSGLILIGVNIINFDSLIFNYRKSVTHRGVDYFYLSGLSSDAQSYDQLLRILEGKAKETPKNTSEFNFVTSAMARTAIKINHLQRKYQNLDIRTLNLSEYLQYQKVKSIDAQKYQRLLIYPN